MNIVTENTDYSYRILVKELNKVLRKYITDDIFPKYYPEHKKKLWRERPLQSIYAADKYSIKFKGTMRSYARNSIVVKLLLKLRGENFMEQADNQGRKEPKSILDEIKTRSEAMTAEAKSKTALIERSKKDGWLAVTLDEINFDLDEVYRKAAKQLGEVKEFGKEEIAVAHLMRDIKNDKTDIIKFMKNFELKERELKIREQESKQGKKSNVIPGEKKEINLDDK